MDYSTIAVAVITTIGGIVTAVIVKRQGRHIEAQGVHLAAVKAEVKNSHETNLRDDVDEIAEAVKRLSEKLDDVIAGQRRHDAEIGGVRTDLRQERQERIAHEEMHR